MSQGGVDFELEKAFDPYWYGCMLGSIFVIGMGIDSHFNGLQVWGYCL